MNTKIYKTLLLKTAILLLVLSACKKEDSTEDILNNNPVSGLAQGELNLNFANTVDGMPLVLSQMNYTNAAGNLYSVNLLKYYISNISLVKEDNTQIKFNQYELIDAENPSSSNVSLGTIEGGIYKSIRFSIGVDSLRNHKGDQTGDLSPQNGMIWTWNTGYIFFKHEGNYMNASSTNDGMVYHYGTDVAYTTIDVPIEDLVIDGNTKKLNLSFDLNKLYSSPNTIDFNDDDAIQSDNASDLAWISRVRANFSNSFSFKSIE